VIKRNHLLNPNHAHEGIPKQFFSFTTTFSKTLQNSKDVLFKQIPLNEETITRQPSLPQELQSIGELNQDGKKYKKRIYIYIKYLLIMQV
jgi:hypothetical protein